MKTYLRITVLFVVAVGILFVIYLAKRATEPQSAMIIRERDRVYAAQDKDRMKNDPVYAAEIQDRLAFLDYRTSLAYNDEKQPDKAIAILQRLIEDEEAKEKGGIRRNARSHANEADYYEALQTSFELKHDEAQANKALDRRTQLMSEARKLERLENREEGKYVGPSAD